jgi:aminobenzoyl-glutamate transport protein
MSRRKEKKKISFSPIYTIWMLTVLVVLLSFLFSVLNLDAQKANIVDLQNSEIPYTVEMSLSTTKNAFSFEGFSFFLKNINNNAEMFKPLLMLVVVIIGLSVAEASGLFKYWFEKFRKVKLPVITAAVLFLAIISSFIGEYSYLILVPLVALFYKYSNYNPILGIITTFIGISVGHGASLMFDNYDYLLGVTTQMAGNIQRNNNYIYNLDSTLFIKIGSVILLTIFGTFAIEKFIFPKLTKKVILDEELEETKSCLLSNITFISLLGLLVYSIIPGLPLSGFLLDSSKTVYVDMLMSSSSLFQQGFVYIFTIIFMLTSFVYGFTSKNFEDSHDYHIGLSKGFENLGPLVIVVFFGIQLIELFKWTNIGEVAVAKMIDLLSTMQISGLPLIIVFIVITLISSILVPSQLVTWKLFAPIAVPLFMRANITPDFTQFIFSAFSGVALAMTPLYIYTLLMIGFIQKYSDDEITIFGTIRLMMPVTMFLMGIWLLIILGWYIIGLPIGVSVFPTI